MSESSSHALTKKIMVRKMLWLIMENINFLIINLKFYSYGK